VYNSRFMNIIIIHLSRSWATCWPVPVSRIRKSLQKCTMILSASCRVVFHYPGQSILYCNVCQMSFSSSTFSNLFVCLKRDQLDVTCFIISLFNAQHVSDVNTSILRSLRLICWVSSWVVLLWFDVCWCYVVVWLWWCGIRMQAPACIRIPHHPSHTTT